MTTAINTFPRAKTGDLVFPYVSRFGVLQSHDIIAFMDAMEEEGHEWTLPHVTAFDAYLTAGQNAGWLEHMLFIAPLWADEAVPNALAVPLVCKGTVNTRSVIGASGQAYGTVTDWEVIPGDQVSAGKIIGVQQSVTPQRVLIAPHSLADVVAKPGFTHAGDMAFGVTAVIAPMGETEAQFRIFGVGGDGLSLNGSASGFLARDINTEARELEVFFGRSSATTISYGAETSYFRMGRIGLAETHRHGTFAAVTTQTGSPTPSVLDLDKAALRRVAYCGVQSNHSDTSAPSSIVDPNANLKTRFFAIDDGSLSDSTLEAAHRSALATLFTALGKNFS